MPIALNNVTKKFGERTVFSGLDLAFKEGKINCIFGPSGCGKTTVLNVLAGLTDYEGQAIRPEKVAYIFQNSRLLPNLTVWENVEYVILDMPKPVRSMLVKSVLEQVELYDRRNDYPSSLSGGMARRVAMARAYAYPAELLLMDEPFSALDLGLKLRQMRVYNELAAKYPRTSVFVTHDIDEALLFADHITVLKQGGVVEATFDIDAPREGRDMFSPDLVALKEKLYTLLK